VKGVRFSAVALVIAATAAICGVAQAAQPARLARLHREVYSFPGGPDGGSLLSFTIEKDKPFSRNPNRPQVARNITLACTSDSTPSAGIPANHAIVLRVPGFTPVIAHRRLAYSGLATVDPIGTTGATASTTVVFKLAFVGRTPSHHLLYPTGVKGSFTSSACSSPVSFSFPYL
jgi:hypothetical protein